MKPAVAGELDAASTRLGSLLTLAAQVSMPALAAQIIWGFQVSAMKLAVSELDPYLVGMARACLAGLAVLVVVGRTEQSLGLRTRHWPRMLAVGFVGMGLNTVFWQLGLAKSTATNAALISSASPVWALVLAVAFGYERLVRRRVAGMALALLGVVLVIQVDGLKLGGETLLGDLLLVGCSFTWACYNVLAVPLLRVYSPMKVTAWAMLIGSACLLLFIPLGVRSLDVAGVSAGAWLGLIYAIAVGASVAHSLWTKAVRTLGPSAALVHSYLMPVVAVAVAALLLGEQLTLAQAVGAVFVLAGVTLANSRRRR